VRISAALFLILVGGTMFGYFLTLTRIPAGLAAAVAGLPVPAPLIVAAIFAVYFVLGALMEEIAILVIMTPVVYPVVIGLGYDGVWFGVMSVMMLLTGLLTPPVGLLSFVTSSATGVSLDKVYRGVTPFWMTLIVANALVIAFPDIALFLPHLMHV
jgi:TRAP-type C4-dicarboxylate transport system permease large subunit